LLTVFVAISIQAHAVRAGQTARVRLTGTVDIAWLDPVPGSLIPPSTIATLVDDRGQSFELALPADVVMRAGGLMALRERRVDLSGVERPAVAAVLGRSVIAVESLAFLAPPRDVVTHAVTGPQPWVTLLCKFQDVAAEPANFDYFQMYGTSRPGLDHYWRELSYDAINLTGSTTVGWVTLPQPRAFYYQGGTGMINFTTSSRDCALAADAQVNFANFSGINMIFNGAVDGMNLYAGLGASTFQTLDGVTRTWRATWIANGGNIGLMGHEMGHTFGLSHSSGPSGFNPWDIMSFVRQQHTIGYHKDLLGWLSGRRVDVVPGTVATITLDGLSRPSTGNQLVKVPIFGTSRFFTVEARMLFGYDDVLPGTAVIIHEVDPARIANPALVIDTDGNGDDSDGGARWVPGEKFTDTPSGVEILVTAATASGFVVVVSNHVTTPTAPAIIVQPGGQTTGAGQATTLHVAAIGSPTPAYQWYEGSSPSTATPIAGATAASYTTPALSSTTSYWVKVTNAVGSAGSNTATIIVVGNTAAYDSTLKAPRCSFIASGCDSGPVLLNSRANISGVTEPHHPNTINSACADGLFGIYHSDPSLDRIVVSTVDDTPLASGQVVRVVVTAFVWSLVKDRIELYYADQASSPTWTLIASLAPVATGIQTLSAQYVLPAGSLQAVRAVHRAGGSMSPCSVGLFDDHDDLIFAVNPAVGSEMVRNGNFANGLSDWFLHEVPDIVHNSASNGVFQYHKANPTTTGSGQAVIFQSTGVGVTSGTGLTAQFDIGNTDTVRKRISVLIIDADFSDLSVCTFWLAPNLPLATYQMKTHPTRDWADAAIYFYAASGSATGDYLLDNVSLQVDGAVSGTRTECIDPARPTPPGGIAGSNLLGNGDFSGPALPPWGAFFDIQHQLTGGVFEFIRPGTPGVPAGGIIQATGQAMTSGQIMTATFQLGNSSSVRKRVTVLLHEHDFSDLSACTFWIPPGAALSNFAMRTYATKAWTDTRFSVYAASTGPDQWTRLDNVTLSRTPGPSQFLGTECFEPGSSPAPHFDPGVVLASSSPVVSAMSGMSGTDGWSASGGFTSSGAAGAADAGWTVEAAAGQSVLQSALPVDLTGASGATLTFDSWLTSHGSSAAVQVSLDGVTWHTLATVAPSDGWTTAGVDLIAFAGQQIYVRFVFDGVAPSIGVAPDVWKIQNVVVTRGGG